MPKVHDNGSTITKLLGLSITGGGIALAVKNPKMAPVGGGLAIAGTLLTVFGAEKELEDSGLVGGNKAH